MTIATNKKPKFSPKAFLQSRRPERFSDSVTHEVGKLDRAVLEHQLSTINKRNKELAFEDFAKRLCEKVICPNLLEQTGPVAGGDGKVDIQTYPVSEQAKTLWYVGINENADRDRWAFAVSTQKAWKDKCRKDIRKIQATDRAYKKAFYITNQYAKANQRSELEDVLSKETDIDVRILDISWILDEVFTGKYEQLAIDTLSIDIDWRRKVKVGTNDYLKNCQLQQLQDDIKDKVNTHNIEHHQLAWFLEEAVLSKELEQPQSQEFFARAISVAKRFGTDYHRFNAHYQYALASYWWYEDIQLFEEQLQLCLEGAKEIYQSGQWGDVVILLGLYTTYFQINKDEEGLLDIEVLRAQAKSFLSKLALQDERPSNSLMAKSYIELLNLYEIESIEQASPIFSSLLSIVKESERLVGFSFLALYDVITILDDTFGDLESYESLLDYFTEQATIREGELQGSLLGLKRGARRLDSNQPYQAIKLLGKSLVGLYKQEAKKELYVAFNLLSEAYRSRGLLWASRANLLMAASMVTDELWQSGEFVPAQIYSYIRLAKIELQLGRLNYALVWWRLAYTYARSIKEDEISARTYQSFDRFLAQCILNIPISSLDALEKLPDLLDQHGLFLSRSMMQHVLGYENIIKDEIETDKEYSELLMQVRDVDLGVSIPTNMRICTGRYTQFKSFAMGCEFIVSFPFRTPLVELAETLLSVLEGFFATSIVDEVMVIETKLEIEIMADDDDEISISHKFDDSGGVLKVDIFCSSFTSDKMNIAGQSIIQKWLNKFIIEVFAYILRQKDIKETLKSMLHDDKALNRSIPFGVCFIGQQNILGNDAVVFIKDILNHTEYKNYKLKRTEQWDIGFPKVPDLPKQIKNLIQGKGDPPKEMLNSELISHQDMKVAGLIKVRLWDRAAWGGTGFALHKNGIPWLTLLFEDGHSGAILFRDLAKELGAEDEEDRLWISIIRHIDKNSPAHYKVCITENIALHHNQTAQLIARINTMEPLDKKNLDCFLDDYKKVGRYILSYATIKNGQVVNPALINRKTIMKSHIRVIDAWEIGSNDFERMAIHDDDDPYIPEGVENPPINQIIKRKNKVSV